MDQKEINEIELVDKKDENIFNGIKELYNQINAKLGVGNFIYDNFSNFINSDINFNNNNLKFVSRYNNWMQILIQIKIFYFRESLNDNIKFSDFDFFIKNLKNKFIEDMKLMCNNNLDKYNKLNYIQLDDKKSINQKIQISSNILNIPEYPKIINLKYNYNSSKLNEFNQTQGLSLHPINLILDKK